MRSDPVLALATSAWTDVESMVILSDHLLETGMVRSASRIDGGDWGFSDRDSGLFDLECRTRQWILDYFGPRMIPSSKLELRVTGEWPNILFIARSHVVGLPLGMRVEVVPGVFEQPRLLRA